jgi:uncharacterized protein (DUF924 family)
VKMRKTAKEVTKPEEILLPSRNGFVTLRLVWRDHETDNDGAGRMTTPDEVLAFWLDEKGPPAWYAGGDDLDAEIQDRFLPTWQSAADGGLSLWLTHAAGTLAYIIITDQFSRNMHRGSGLSFSTDGAARAAAKMAIKREWDMRIDEPARQFFYMPLMHSESLADQDRAVRLVKTRMPETGDANIDHARAHREIIRMFGRFPFRNDALGRVTREAEATFMAEGGYRGIMNELQKKAA